MASAAGPGGRVMTVTGPRAAASLGVTDAHDHLSIRSPALPGQEIDDLDRILVEAADGRASGLAALVELTPIGLGRRPDHLRAVAERTGLTVIGATGYHRDAHYPAGHWVHDAPIETLADRAIADLLEGMHPDDWNDPDRGLDPARAGVIKAGASYQRISRGEARRLEAIAAAARASGAAIIAHTEVGTCGADIVDRLERDGVPTSRIALAHLDRNPDPEVHLELAARGVTLEYDTVGRIKYRPDSDLLDLIETVAAAGHLDRIALGLDLGTHDYYRSYDGGPGLRYLMETFVPRLRRRLGDAAVQTILVDAPARLLALAPVAAAVPPEPR